MSYATPNILIAAPPPATADTTHTTAVENVVTSRGRQSQKGQRYEARPAPSPKSLHRAQRAEKGIVEGGGEASAEGDEASAEGDEASAEGDETLTEVMDTEGDEGDEAVNVASSIPIGSKARS